MGTNGRALSLLLIQVLLIAAAIYIGVAESAFPGASTFGRAALIVVCVGLSFLAGEVSRLRTHFGALLEALKVGGASAPRDDKGAIDVLIAALEGGSATARGVAHKNLVRITGQEFPPDAGPWRAWWATARAGFVRPPSGT